jgi:protein RecA
MARTKTEDKSVLSPDDIYSVGGERGSTFSSGCTLLDKVLGGGWAYNRMLNLVGDTKTGKTLLAIEAAANFRRENPDGQIVYAECEAAFDVQYAGSVGLPADAVDFPAVFTVEDVFKDIDSRIKEKDPDEPLLYIVDSMDALSDVAEQKREVDEGSYAMTKAKQVSTWMRRQNQGMSKSNITLLVISQVRDNIGVSFGEKHKRSGGRALDFYASQIVWLTHFKQLKRTVKKVERVYGCQIKAKAKKNRIGMPFRECSFPLIFGYGVQDVIANIDWLDEIGQLDKAGMDEKEAKRQKKRLDVLSDDEFQSLADSVRNAVMSQWDLIEDGFKPVRSKY